MAQYYQLVGQDQSNIQTVTLEELRQYYPNLTCVESSAGVQYVINQDENGQQFQTQQVLLASADQQIVLNSGEAPQQIIVDQSQISYQQPTQQYVQENEMVADYQQAEINSTQQIYYATANSVKQQPLIQSPPAPIINQQLTARSTVNQSIVTSPPRVVGQHVNQVPVRPMVPQQALNNAHLMPQRRVSVGQNQQQVVAQQRQAQTNPAVRLQYSNTVPVVQEQIQEPPRQNQQQIPVEQDDTQLIVNEGRIMTLGQLKQELAQNQQENINVQQTVIANQGVQNCAEKPYKQPPPKRNYRRPANNRGGRNRGRGGAAAAATVPAPAPAQSPRLPVEPTNHLNVTPPKPFQQLTNTQKPMVQYHNNSHKNLQQIKQQSPQTPHQMMQHQQRPLHHTMPQQPQTHPMPQQPHRAMPQTQAMMQHNLQQSPMQAQTPVLQPQQPAVYQPSPNGRSQALIPLSPQVHNGHAMQSPVYSPPASQVQQQYLDDSSSSLSDEYKDSARMLVCLENGEQRLITFTLPKESCTVQDLLEQVGVPFNADTKIECISNPGNDIDYIVNVGAVNSLPFALENQQVLTVDNLGDSQECIVSQTGAVIPVSEAQQETPPKPKSPEKPPEPPKEIPKFVPGCLAVCNHCGYLSEDFNRCQRCKTKLPEDVKVKSIANKTEEKPVEEKKPVLETPKPVLAKPPPIPKLIPAKITPTPPKASPKTPRGKKQKAQDLEPVVLTLSSDDEDTVPKAPVSNALQLANRIIDNAVTLSALQKEPVIHDDSNTAFECGSFEEGIVGGGLDDDSKSAALTSTSLPCRTVRIGSYKFIPKEEVSISSLGIKLYVPMIRDPSETYHLFIPIKYIIKVLGNFSKALPVLFFYVTPSISNLIRKNLKMELGSELYFDPLSKQESFKRITLLPDIIYEDTKAKIKDIFLTTPYKMLEELSSKEANDILIRTCPRDIPVYNKANTQYNTSFTEMRQLLIYPPGKGGIAINAEDFLCLAQDQFLNDVIIDFYLKYLVTDVLASPMQEKVYIFSSFFYKRLTTKPAKASKRSNPYEVDPTLTPAEKRHCRVKSWTKNVNIFEKDYVIIPINENSHWFLAIICYPGLDGCRSMNDSTKVIKLPVKEKKKINASITIGNTTITSIKSSLEEKLNSTVNKPIKCEDEEGSDRDEADGDESELEETETDTDLDDTLPEKKTNEREPIKQPCILIFDSLAGASRSRVVATLRDYLTCEHRTKLNSNKSFTKDNIKGACPKVPQQMNFTDCGLYVLQYVESFFKDPITDYHIPIKLLRNWFDEIVVTRKREEISNLIKELMLENNKDPSFLPDITFPTVNGELVSNMEQEHFSEGEEEEEGEHHEAGELGDSPDSKQSNSLLQLQNTYNSDSSNESPSKQTDSSGSSTSTLLTNSVLSTTQSFIVSDVNTVKPDLSEFSKKSNRETMSYLKSKRITRHKNNDGSDMKKQKIE